MADPLVIVDGDNVAHRRGGAKERMRDDLVADCSVYAEQVGCDVVIVFDGHGQERKVGRVSVRHAGGETADTTIERIAHRSAGERSVTVVSSDSALRMVAARGAVDAMSAREFSERLDSAPRPQQQRPAEGRGRYQLGDALDPATREALERIRRGSKSGP